MKKRVFSPPIVFLLLPFSRLFMFLEAYATKFIAGDNQFCNPNIKYIDWVKGRHFYLIYWLCKFSFSIYVCMSCVYERTFIYVMSVVADSL